MLESFDLLYIYLHFENKNSQALKHDETSLPVPTRPAQAWLWNEKENLFSSEQTQLSSR